MSDAILNLRVLTQQTSDQDIQSLSDSRSHRRAAVRQALLHGVVSIAVALPCFWGPHIHALDFGSHLYNGWLTQLAAEHSAPGISVVPVWTNTLFDWIVSALLSIASVGITERLSACIAVLICFWSCFIFTSRVVGYHAWNATPLLVPLTYGFMFRLGFFNFYLATAFSVAALALLWCPTRRRVLLSVPLLALAAAGNFLPPVWALSSALYVQLLRRLPGRYRVGITVCCALVIALVNSAVVRSFPSYTQLGRLSATSLLDVAIAGQLATYDGRFLIIAYAWLLASVAAVALRLPIAGAVVFSPVLHLWLLHLFAFAIVPDGIQLSQYAIPLSFLPHRIAFFASILAVAGICCFVKGRITWIFTALATICLGLTYTVDTAGDIVAKHIEDSVNSLPAYSSVVAAFKPINSRIHTFTHSLDRACLGHCFNFGNYEPPSRAFRVRVAEGSPVATADSSDVFSIESGEFVRRATDPPLYTVCNCTEDPHRLCTRLMAVGDRVCSIDPTLLTTLR
jgi:hypothetical protein